MKTRTGKTACTVILVHGSCDEGLFRSLSSLSAQTESPEEVLLAGPKKYADASLSVWEKHAVRSRLKNDIFQGSTPLDALVSAMTHAETETVLLVRTGDVPDREMVASASLNHREDIQIVCRNMLWKGDPLWRFLPSFTVMQQMFEKSGWPLFHGPLTGMSFSKQALGDLLEGMDGKLPLEWGLYTRLLRSPGLKVQYSSRVRGRLDTTRNLSLSLSPERLRALGFPAPEGGLPGVREGDRESDLHALMGLPRKGESPAMLPHTPAVLLDLAVLLEAGDEHSGPITEFILKNRPLFHEQEYPFAAKHLRNGNFAGRLERLGHLGSQLWPGSREIQRWTMHGLITAGRPGSALRLFRSRFVDDGLVLAQRIRACRGTGDEAHLATCVVEAQKRLKNGGLQLNEKCQLIAELAVTLPSPGIIKELFRLWELSPGHERLAVLLMSALVKTDRRNEALVFFSACVSDGTPGPETLARMAMVLGDARRARPFFWKAWNLTAGPVPAQTLREWCGASRPRGNLVSLFTDCAIILNDQDQLAELRLTVPHLQGLPSMQKGLFFRKLGENESSLFWFTRALEESPEDHEAHVLLGGALAKATRFDEAKQVFERALELAPERREVHLNIVDLYKYQQQWEEGLQRLEVLETLAPDLPGIALKRREIQSLRMAEEEIIP